MGAGAQLLHFIKAPALRAVAGTADAQGRGMIRFGHLMPLLAFMLASACSAPPTGRRMRPPAPTTIQAELGYRDVIQAGEDYARQQGYALASRGEAVEIRPNYWRLRFGLAEDGSGKLLHLEFDGATGTIVREEVIPVTPAPEP